MEKVLVIIFFTINFFHCILFTDEHRRLCAGPKLYYPTDTTHTNGGSKPPVEYIAVNECILRPHICGEGDCIDTIDGYECLCKPGFRKGDTQVCEGQWYFVFQFIFIFLYFILNEFNSKFFIDIDECREGKCQNGRCTNTPGSFICLCPPGFDISPDGTMCTDHDECKEIGMCTNGICINMDGSFKCQCKSGFKLSPSKYACIGKYIS